MSERIFVDGIKFKKLSENAPEWIKMKFSINRKQLINWLQSQSDDWIDVDVKESKAGNLYSVINDWKPNKNLEKQDVVNINEVDEPPF